MIIDVAYSQVLYPYKGEDTVVLRQVGDRFVLAVADGLSTRNGLAAARWVAQRLLVTDAADSVYSLFDDLTEALRRESACGDESETTLSCGILRKGDRSGTLVFDYFAIGDTPIWKVVRSGDDRYPYQRYLVHGGPYPAENARLYSTISLRDRSITGAVSFGSVVLGEAEVLVVCSDGLPEREVLVRDLGSERPKTLCSWLFADSPFTNESLDEVLADYQHRDVFVDDATIIAARLGRAAAAEESVKSMPATVDAPADSASVEDECTAGTITGQPEAASGSADPAGLPPPYPADTAVAEPKGQIAALLKSATHSGTPREKAEPRKGKRAKP